MIDTDEKQVRPFADFLQDQRGGTTHHELSEGLNEVISAVAATGKAGSITLTIKIKTVNNRANSSTVVISDVVKVNAPADDRGESIFFVDSHGNAVRHDPAQARLPLREIQGGKTLRDSGEAVSE